MTEREALKLALEALEANQPINYCMNNNGEKFPMMQEDPFRFERNIKAITAIREALAQPEQEPVVQWHLSKDGLPPVGSYVVGGYFYKDTRLKGDPEGFAWGQCRVIKDDHPDFPDGKRWITFGPSHNQITYWCWPPKKPGDTSPPQRTWVGLTDEEIHGVIRAGEYDSMEEFARAIEAKLKSKNT